MSSHPHLRLSCSWWPWAGACGVILPYAAQWKPTPAPSSGLTRKPVPPAVFVHHHVITRENVDHYYPNDALMGVGTFAGY